MMPVTIILITFNSSRFLDGLRESLQKQTKAPQDIIVVDNASSDNTVEKIRKFFPHAHLIQNPTNVWFSQAVNQALGHVTHGSVLLLNHDATLNPTALDDLSTYLEKHPNVASVSGKVMRNERQLDSYGITASRSRRFVNRGEGEGDSSQYPDGPIFGLSGGLVLHRLAALLDIKIQNEILDTDFVAYKDDVDISYRLRLRGWDIHVIHQQVGTHGRHIDAASDLSDRTAAQHRKKFRPVIRQMSTRNHIWTLIKNEPASSLFIDFPWICWYEMKKFVFILFRDPQSLRGYLECVQGLPRMLQKRRCIQAKRKIQPAALRQLCRQ